MSTAETAAANVANEAKKDDPKPGAKPTLKWHETAGPPSAEKPGGTELPKGSLKNDSPGMTNYYKLFENGQRVASIPAEYFASTIEHARHMIQFFGIKIADAEASIAERVGKLRAKTAGYEQYIATYEKTGGDAKKANAAMRREDLLKQLEQLEEVLADDVV